MSNHHIYEEEEKNINQSNSNPVNTIGYDEPDNLRFYSPNVTNNRPNIYTRS